MKIGIVAGLVLASSNVLANEVVVDLGKIAGKSEAEVATVIGKPKSCESSKYGKKCLYTKAGIEIVYIKSKADWITIEAVDSVGFDENAIAHFGYDAQAPSLKNPNIIEWKTIRGIKSLSVFPAGKNADYVYVKVNTL